MDQVTELRQEILALYGEYKKRKPSGTAGPRVAGGGETRLIASEQGTTISYVVHNFNTLFSSCFILGGDFPDGFYSNGNLHADEAVVTQSYNSPVVIMSSRGFRRAVRDSYSYKGRGVSRGAHKELGLEFEVWNSIVENSLREGKIFPPNDIVDEPAFLKLIKDYESGRVEPEKRNAFDALSCLLDFYSTYDKADLTVLKRFSPENRRFELAPPNEVAVASDEIVIQTNMIIQNNKLIRGKGKVAVVVKSPPPIYLPSAVTSLYGQIPMEKSDLPRSDGITRASATQIRLSPFRSYIENFLLPSPNERRGVSATISDGNMIIYIEGSEVVSPR